LSRCFNVAKAKYCFYGVPEQNQVATRGTVPIARYRSGSDLV